MVRRPRGAERVGRGAVSANGRRVSPPAPALGRAPLLAERLRLAAAAWSFARGRGALPQIVTGFRGATFADLESPLGVCRPRCSPLDGYFETLVALGRYAALGYRGWSLIDGFRPAAFSFAAALLLFGWAAGNNLRMKKHCG